MDKPKIVAVVGPTASGKTSLSIEIAKNFEGEVISADSRQIYRGMDIGTGKVTEDEMDNIPHHLLDIVDPMQSYTAVDFKTDATAAILETQDHGHLPIIAGGTFFYLDLLRGKIQSAPVPPNKGLRIKLEKLSNEELFRQLQTTDPKRAESVDKDNQRRLVRSLEIVDALGSVPEPVTSESPYQWLIIGLDVPKETLRTNFEKRLAHWLVSGFQNEVEQLLEQGVSRERFQEFGFEYTLMLDFIDGEISDKELKEKFIQKNWQYAKRQRTWLKRDGEIEWFKPNQQEAIMKRVKNFLHEVNS